jgi:hypothetical protein
VRSARLLRSRMVAAVTGPDLNLFHVFPPYIGVASDQLVEAFDADRVLPAPSGCASKRGFRTKALRLKRDLPQRE